MMKNAIATHAVYTIDGAMRKEISVRGGGGDGVEAVWVEVLRTLLSPRDLASVLVAASGGAQNSFLALTRTPALLMN